MGFGRVLAGFQWQAVFLFEACQHSFNCRVGFFDVLLAEVVIKLCGAFFKAVKIEPEGFKQEIHAFLKTGELHPRVDEVA